MQEDQLRYNFQKFCQASRNIILKLQPNALENATTCKVQGVEGKLDLSPEDAMASVMLDIEDTNFMGYMEGGS